MKKLVSLLLALSLCLGLSAALAEAPASYALTEETFTLEQGPVWYFWYFDVAEDAFFELNATPAWGDNWQFSANPDADQVYHSICEWDGIQAMPGTWIGEYIDIVIAWRAPQAGTVVIEPTTFEVKDDGNEWPPYLVQILKSTGVEGEYALLFPGDVESPWAQTPVTTEAIEVEVAQGEDILFVVRAGDDGGAAVSVQPVITYK